MRKKYLQQGLIFLGKSNLKMSYICNHKQFLLILLQMGRNLKCLLIFSNFHHFHGRPEKKARDKRNYNFRPKDPTSDLAILWHTICPNNVAATSLNLRKFKYIILRLFLAQYSCSRPQCTYSGIFSPNKKWFFWNKFFSQNFFKNILTLFYVTFQCGRYNIKKIQKKFFFPMKNWKNHPKKLLRISPDPFFPRYSPSHSQQPKIDFPYHEISRPDISQWGYCYRS